MQGQSSRRAVLAFGSAWIACFSAGCMKSDEIPLVEFPKGMAPPPAPSKDASKSPQGVNTSSGEPPH